MKPVKIKQLLPKMGALGPYVALLILPGGMLLALLLWLAQRRNREA